MRQLRLLQGQRSRKAKRRIIEANRGGRESSPLFLRKLSGKSGGDGMSVIIARVEQGSIAQKAGIASGDLLHSINGNPIADVLDYRFYMTERRLTLSLERKTAPLTVSSKKGEYDDLGLEFDTYLMDRQHHCKNKCIFCFVDQLPTGLRDSLYFKDDDSRMSFLFGSYVTLTNMSEEEIRRIIKMRISPINISVHTTNPQLRVTMLANPHAADSLRYLPMLTDTGILVNTQLVLCPGINDGDELIRSLYDLEKLAPNLQSIALVPVGLTCHRQGLYPLRPMDKADAEKTLDIADRFGAEMLQKHGSRMAFASDELFLIAERPIPEADYYEDFDQLNDGVGIHALLRQQFMDELEDCAGHEQAVECALACGTAAAPLLEALLQQLQHKFPQVRVHIYGIENRLFGATVNVSGLLCGHDLAHGLAGKPLGERLLLPGVMLRHETDKFLDDTTVDWLSNQLKIPVEVIEVDGTQLLHAVTTSSC
ncbi:MAG: DUF512 domain-containing protein [Angelakisella sp.]